jgi:predicted lactoylglutathione lyase
MGTKIFVNLPVKNLDASMAFFKTLGYTFNPQFSDATGAAMVINEHIYAMLLTHDKFKQFTPKAVADASATSEVLLALSFDSRGDVDEIAEKALEAGATVTRPPSDYGFMYGRSINDLDGHVWEFFWMDPAQVQS